MTHAAKLLASVALGLISTVVSAGSSHHAKIGDLTIHSAKSRPNLPNRPMAAYMMIENAGAGDRLVSAASPAFDIIELHTMSEEDGVMKMQQIEAVDLPAGAMTALAPGGKHLMLFGADESYKAGDTFPLTLIFESAGSIDVMVKVGKVGQGHHNGHGTEQTN